MDASSIEAASAFFSIPDDCAATVASWLRTEERTALAATSRTATALFRSSVASLRIVYDHLPRGWEGDDERRLLAGLSSLMRSLPCLARITAICPVHKTLDIPNTIIYALQDTSVHLRLRVAW